MANKSFSAVRSVMASTPGSAAAFKKGDNDLLELVNAILQRLIAENKITESVQEARILADKI